MTARVLVVVEQLRRPVPGGIGRYAVGLLEGLRARGEGAGEVTLFASRPPGRWRAVAGGGARTAADEDPLARFGFGVRTSSLPGPIMTRVWDLGLGGLAPGEGVVHAVSLAVPPLARSRAHRRRGGRRPALCVVVHDLAWRRHPEATTPRGRRWHEAALQRARAPARALVVPSAVVAEDLATECDGGGPPVTVIPWGADHLPPPDRRGAAALLAEQGVEGPYLLSASTLEPRKNLRRLADAYRQAVLSLPEPWPLVVAGPRGWGEEVLGNGSGAAPGRVVMLGRVDDGVLAGLYAGAQVFAYVPLVEGYGFPPVEAMSAGVPVVASSGVPSVHFERPDPAGRPDQPVASAHPAPAASAHPAPAALVVDPGNVDAIAEALVMAAVDEERRGELVDRGRALVASRTWSAVAARHRHLWDRLG
jgi:glycosyltransferase involved in cell wall biosynthesis